MGSTGNGTYDRLTLREARKRYLRGSNLREDDYDNRWVPFKLGPIPFFMPNFEARKKAVKLHDIHHLLTGYEMSWVGEAEISAWEFASGGYKQHPIAWIYGSIAIAIGFALDPKAVKEAYNLGLNCHNLYDREYTESLLNQKVGSIRCRLGLKVRKNV